MNVELTEDDRDVIYTWYQNYRGNYEPEIKDLDVLDKLGLDPSKTL